MTRRADPVLVSLWAADHIARRLTGVGGPQRPKSSLGERVAAPEITEEMEKVAMHQMFIVGRFFVENADEQVRKALLLAVETRGARPVRTLRQVAAEMRVSLTKAHRLLHDGLRIVGERLQHDQILTG